VILRIYFLIHLSNVLDSAENGLCNAVIVDAAPTGYISDCMMNFVLKVNAAVSTKSSLQSFEMKMFDLEDLFKNAEFTEFEIVTVPKEGLYLDGFL